jgi:hypothetical protein
MNGEKINLSTLAGTMEDSFKKLRAEPQKAELVADEFLGKMSDILTYALLWKRDDEQGLRANETVWDELDYRQRRDIAARLANFMVEQNKSVIDAETANTTLANALAWVGREKSKTNDEAKTIRERFSARGGILRVTKVGALEFVHNTFKEFLAASVFANELTEQAAKHLTVDQAAA